MVPGRLSPQQDEGAAVRKREQGTNVEEEKEEEDFQGENRVVRIVWTMGDEECISCR